ncbi:MAG: hypothetical protein IKH58_07250 [Bacteroidales bacterium]|jgi:hypothetical protein|nr:hypothetical protein [Bacteroidales bacterium]
MRVAYDKDVLTICLALNEQKIEYFLPTDDAVVVNGESTTVVKKPKLKDLIFVHSSKSHLTELKHKNTKCRYLRFITYIPHSEIRNGMTLMERSASNRIIIIPDAEMEQFIKVVSNDKINITLIPYSETFNHIGRKIRILQGPLEDCVGTLRRIKNNKHVHFDCGGIVTVQLGYMRKEMYELLD